MNIILTYLLILIGFIIFSTGLYYISNASAECITMPGGDVEPKNKQSFTVGGSFGIIFGVVFMLGGLGFAVTN
jgi:hypothetical protein